MKVGLLLALGLASIALLVACDNGGDGATPGADGAPIPAVTGSDGGTPTPTEPPAGTATAEPEICLPNPDQVTLAFQIIDEPRPGTTVTSPVTITGQLLAFEATYLIGIFHSDGTPIVVETSGTADAAEIGERAPFSIDIPFDVNEPTPACIWVYEASAMDGSPINVGQIPVTLSP